MGTVGGAPDGPARPSTAPLEQPMAVKILIVTGDAAESLEVLYPYQRLGLSGA
ncbi:hypothetical protein GCM10010302_26300 [Streptomyces polychromogenes]|uniref:Uncharacterized protein n=1 Tax=Streptomyces polychromogenes TaxID=67342 RepID=A0ABP3EZG2_9ACTN